MRQVIIDNTTTDINSLKVIAISVAECNEFGAATKWKIICNDGVEFITDNSQFVEDVKADINNYSTKGFEIIVLSPSQVGPDGVPTIENPKTNAIYLAPKQQGSKNVFVEWIYVNNDWEKLGESTIDLSGYVKKVNNVGPDSNGNVEVKTFTKINASDITRNGTTAQYCQSVCNAIHPKEGQAFLDNDCRFSDMPFEGNAEILITVPVDNLLVLELTSTDSFASGNVAGKWIAMWYGALVMNWQGYMTCPKDNSGKYIPIKDSDGISKYYLDQQLLVKQNTLTAGTGISIENNVISSTNNIDIINDLTSTRTDAALSANQGKILNDNKSDKSTTLAGYGITDAKIENNTITLGTNTIAPLTEHQSLSDYVKKVNNVGPDTFGNVNVTTFSEVPSSVDLYKTGHTTSEFCRQFLTVVDPPVGSAYLTGGICFTDMPKSFFINEEGQGGYATCELIIYVPSEGCFLLEIDTTNNFTQKWKPASSGKFRAMYDTSKKELSLLWTGSLTCPQSTELIGSDGNKEFKFIPSKDSDAVSLYWLKKFAEKNNLQMPD